MCNRAGIELESRIPSPFSPFQIMIMMKGKILAKAKTIERLFVSIPGAR